MQIKTTLRFHLTPVTMAIIKGNNNNKQQMLEKMWQKQKHLHIAGGNAN
jgi:hypothetical protein